ncbi:MAG: protein kinase [Planctomycetaceae bacterium]
MSDGASPARTQNDETIDSILAEYLRRVDAGETVDREAFLAAHPESAAALKSYFETADVVEQMAGSLVSESIASDAQNRDDATLTLPSPDLQPPAPDPARDSTLRNQQATIVKVQSSLTGLETLPPLAGEQNQQKPSSSESPSGPAPEKIGRYRIEKVLGQGAMGVVYLAHDSNLGRRVALKIPRFTEADGHEFIERFYREARTAANLRSPHICPVYDVGEIDGAPFITMAFIEGKPLSDYIRPACPQPERQVAGVVRKLAVALDEAHRAGIVHRDLKPANIMVDTRGEPIIMDFGLAREMSADPESTRLTHFGMMIGTPAYMPPEQVNGENDLVGPRSDIYALGVILYELLTGRIPFQGSLAAVLGQILTVEPVPPSQLRPDLDPRIETICLKLMSKKMEDRPGSMKEVAGMLTEYLRSPRSQSSAAPTVIETPATPPPTRSIASRDRLKETPKVEIDAIGRTARRLFAKHDYEQAAQLLSQIPETARTEKHSELLQECIERNDEVNFLIARLQDGLSRNQVMGLDNIVSRLLELKPGNRLGIEARERVAQAALRRRRVTMSRPMGLGSIPPAVQWITLWLAFFGFMYGMVIIYVKRGDKETKVIGSLEPGEEFEAVVRSGADGETTIEMKARTAGMIPSDRKPAAKVSPRALQPAVSTIGSAPGISSTYRFVEVRQLSGHTASISCVAFFPDGERAVSGSHDKTLRIWNVRDGKELFRLNHNRNTTSVAVSPDGSRIASAHIGGEVNVWDVATRANVLKIPRSQQLVSAVRFSRDGKSIVFGSRGHFAAVWEIAGKREVKRFETGDTGWIHGVEFLPDGRSALAGTTDGRLIQWSVETGNAIRTIRQFPSWIEAIACSADGKRIACGGLQAGKESPNRIWDFASGIELARFEGHTDCVEGVAFALGDRCVVTGSQDRTLRLWDAGTGAELARAESKTHVMHHLAVAPDGSQVLTGGGLYNVPDKPTSDDRDYQLRLWRITEAASPKPTAAPSPAVAGRMGAIHVLNGHTKSINDLAISPDGRWLASCGHDQTVRVWDLSSGQEVKLINGHFNAAVFTPDGKRLILGQDNQNPRSEIRLISVDDWKEVDAVKEAGKTVNDLAVSSDGKMLLSSHPGGVRLWNLESRQLIRYFEKPSDRAIARIAFDSSNRHAFGAAGHDKFVRWEVQSGRIVSSHSRP